LALKFITRMKGHVWFRNCETDHGAVFSISIPCSADMTDSHHSIETSIPDELELRPEDSALVRALVVDDSVINLKVLVRMLERMGVSQIDTAFNGAVALERLTNSNELPNLIFV
jgi:PleD family two-component response regulator